VKVAYLGPAGTFSEDALRAAGGEHVEPSPAATVFDAIQAVGQGDAALALVPFENSIEGSVRATLDALAFDGDAVTIVGEHDHPIRHSLIARTALAFDRIEAVLSHPQILAQCARFLREELPQAEVRAAASSAEAIRTVSREAGPWAALGAGSAAALYGCSVLREGVEDEGDNVTRFVWVAPAGSRAQGNGATWRTSLVFSELGEDHPGALVDALYEFSNRDVNLTRIESRPLRQGLGRYMFFIDVDDALADERVAAAVEALRGKAETVRVLGNYPVAPGVPNLAG
jgi:prephenate dehydratase